MRKFFIISFVIFYFIQQAVVASHIRAGEITARRVGCFGLTYEFVLTAYRDTGSEILFGSGIFDFGDGESIALNPDNFFDKEIIDDEVERVQFRIQHTYRGNSTYTVSYNEDFRNAGILNMSSSSSVPFYVETIVRLDPAFGCNDTPLFLIPPVDKAAVGAVFYHNPGAFDINGDSIAFKFVTPKSRTGTPVPNFVSPEKVVTSQNSQQSGPATFTLDELLGDLIWDAPALKGEYNIAFIAEEWRKINGQYVFLGSVVRDMQIIVGETDNNPPVLTIPKDTCVEAGTLLEATITAMDPDENAEVIVEAFGGPFILNPAAELNPDDKNYYPVPHTVDFSWQTNCDQIRDEPYLIRFKATDNGPGINLTAFETWSVTIVPPSPKNVTISKEPQRSIRINWDPYNCGLAENIQVYRRVDSFDFTPENCEIGIPENGGYELIGSVPVDGANGFLDNNNGQGLDFGATYCYRLVAVFAEPTGGESYASLEVCERIDATGPVITNVSVQSTDANNGEINVSWLPPLEIDQGVYPPPYKYQLLRSSGGAFTPVAVVEDDTTFTDSGLNTLSTNYSYRLGLYLLGDEINSNNLIEVSATASSINIIPRSLFESVGLSWSANVPWSNMVQDFPYHYIYRNKVEGNNAEDFILIDSVNVIELGMNYIDSGAFNGQKLNNNEEYCYYVTTQGSYGNDLIFSPLLNDSKEICVQPDDLVNPCPPFEANFEINSEDACLSYLADKECGFSDFQNTISWSANLVDSCDNVVSYYEIFYINDLEDEYALVGTSVDTFFVHTDLDEYAGCYKIRAVDQSNNRSSFSEAFCKENCPNLKFPNVITPGDGNGMNDVFTPFYPGAVSSGVVPFENCPRFLQSIEFDVYNRYGKLVYSYVSGGENSLYINWPGINNNGEELPSTTYFYEVRATFDMLREENKVREYKGWVQILR